MDDADPRSSRFASREALVPFFGRRPAGTESRGTACSGDEAAGTGVAGYRDDGHHRWHGAAIVEVGADRLIARWREWQHRDDARGWEALLAGPG